jgi:hypothetical protein
MTKIRKPTLTKKLNEKAETKLKAQLAEVETQQRKKTEKTIKELEAQHEAKKLEEIQQLSQQYERQKIAEVEARTPSIRNVYTTQEKPAVEKAKEELKE